MYNILLLGSSGFIGKNIIEALSPNKKYNLVLLSRNDKIQTEKFYENKSIKILKGDFKNTNLIESIIEEYEINIIIHLISGLNPSSSDNEFYNTIDEVIVPTFKLIDFISNKNIKFIYFSSGGTIYGNASSVIKETHQKNPINKYGYSKLLIENYIKHKSNISKLDYIILRPSNVYGKYQSFTGNQGFISVAINNINNNIPLQIWGDGYSVRDYIHVDDVIAILIKLIDSTYMNVTFNLSTNVGTTLLQIIEITERHLNKKAIIKFNEKRIVDAEVVILDNTKLTNTVKHNFTELSEGIQQQIKYYLNNIANEK